jgi:hypothetical protein
MNDPNRTGEYQPATVDEVAAERPQHIGRSSQMILACLTCTATPSIGAKKEQSFIQKPLPKK